MKLAKVIFGLLLCALGIFCGVKAIQTQINLHGHIDMNDEVRDWSTGAVACNVIGAAIMVFPRKKNQV